MENKQEYEKKFRKIFFELNKISLNVLEKYMDYNFSISILNFCFKLT